MNRRVLIADSHPDGAESFALLLELHGLRPVTAYSGPDALAMAAAIHPAVAFLSLHMPLLTGLEVGKMMCEGMHFPRPRFVIALTGDGSEKARVSTRDAGFDHHLLKPADPFEILRILQALDEPMR